MLLWKSGLAPLLTRAWRVNWDTNYVKEEAQYLWYYQKKMLTAKDFSLYIGNRALPGLFGIVEKFQFQNLVWQFRSIFGCVICFLLEKGLQRTTWRQAKNELLIIRRNCLHDWFLNMLTWTYSQKYTVTGRIRSQRITGYDCCLTLVEWQKQFCHQL